MIQSSLAINIPLSLYVHLPWCVKKCPYCDFNSHPLRQAIPEQAYIQALLKDLEHDAQWVAGRRLTSIFFGGGTPSLFSAKGFETLLESFNALLPFEPNIEITMEANPGTIEHDAFKAYQLAGINRISLGVQSFQDKQLEALGRIHRHAETCSVIEELKRLDISFNLDLMHGLPQQTLELALDDLSQAIQFEPHHLSWYQLTLEPNTFFYKHPPALPESELRWQIETEGKKLLAAAGYQQYEISAYARKNQQCRHNLNYWKFGDYLGIGAGAHGKITVLKPDWQVTRTIKHRHPQKYLTSPKRMTACQTVSKDDLIFEYMLNRLRLYSKVTWVEFEEKTSLSKQLILPTLKQLEKNHLLALKEDGFKLSPLGARFFNDVVTEFLPAANATKEHGHDHESVSN